MSEIQSQYVELKVADGTTMRAWFASPPKTNIKAGLMLFQEAFGVNPHIRSLTDRFARRVTPQSLLSCITELRPDSKGSTKIGPSIALAKQLTPNLENDVRATHAFWQQVGDKIACTGYCMGGRVSYLAKDRAGAGSGFLLWRRTRRCYRPCIGVLRAHALLLGRTGQAHYRRASPEGCRRNARFAASVGAGHVLRCRPRILLRSALQL